MSEFPHELIRQVQISTRAAAGLSDYNPSEPTLPALPSLSAAIAASDPSPPEFRCENCKGRLLRGPESIICLYCGRGPNFDVAPEPISFTSSIGYQWLLRSLRLDGSEVVDRTTSSEQDQGQNPPKTLTSLSDLLNFKISWLGEPVEKEASVSDKHAKESKKCSSFTGVPPDKFFLTLERNIPSDISTEKPLVHNPIAATGGKDVTSHDHQNLFQNFPSSEPTDTKRETSEAFSGWEADFQSADFENQDDSEKSNEHFVDFQSADFENQDGSEKSNDHSVDFQSVDFENQDGSEKSNEHFVPLSTDSTIQNQDTKPSESSRDMVIDHSEQTDSVSESSRDVVIDHSEQTDSVFLPGDGPDYSKPEENPAVSSAFDDWNSDGMWQNLSSNESHFVATVDTKDHQSLGDQIPGNADDPFASSDFLQDFQSNPNYTDMTENKESMNNEHMPVDKDLEEWDDFMGLTNSQVPVQSAPAGSEQQVSTSGEKSSEMDLFGFSNKSEEEDWGSFSQSNLYSSVTSNSDAPVELNTNKSEDLVANWFDYPANNPSDESGHSANKGDIVDEPAKDDVQLLLSQMHDLSFMLETELSIPSGSDTRKE